MELFYKGSGGVLRKYLCVANSGSNSVSVFSINNASAYLTLVGTYPTILAGPQDVLINWRSLKS